MFRAVGSLLGSSRSHHVQLRTIPARWFAQPSSSLKKKRFPTKLTHGVAHVQTTYNNTIISITKPSGDVVLYGSCGTAGFKGARRSTYYAAQVAAEEVGRRACDEHGLQTLDVSIKGLGQGRTAVPKGFANVGIQITSLQDKTPQPHNGCRRRKPRRL